MAAGPIQDYLRDLHARLRGLGGGKLAAYIPELAKADPNALAIAIATVDGEIYSIGDDRTPFSIQSVSKPFVYAHALEVRGTEEVFRHVGVEPTGEAFNAIELDDVHRRAFNPMINSGAIATSGLVEGETQAERIAALDALFARFAGRPLALDKAVFHSESATGHRNRAMAWLMLNAGILTREPEQVLELYFRQCSLLVDARDLALMGATLANNGVNPRTGERALAAAVVGDVLTVMNSCGMYNYAGQWAFEIGLPAKSGVSGSILAVAPGQAGIAIWSPPIDANGTSVRGVAAARAIAEDFGLRTFTTHPSPSSVIRRSFSGLRLRSKRVRPPSERSLLDRAGAAIAVIELQGPLFFGAAERLIRLTSRLAGGAGWIILDFRHVLSADDAARRLIGDFRAALAQQGRRLIAANLPSEGPLAPLCEDFTRQAGALLFGSRDRALEHAEDALLARQGIVAQHSEVALDDMAVLEGLAPEVRAAIAGIADRRTFQAGAIIAEAGEHADRMFLLASGRVSVVVGEGDPVRVGTLGPGMAFGELALIDGGARVADVVAEEEVVVYALPITALRGLAAQHPELMATLLANVVRDLSDRLRLANGEISALER
ncbi:MAG: glutaminase A [Sphingomonadaceae bacterium]|nr:glutaminase A [Sphingomonadaceae bacterium]